MNGAPHIGHAYTSIAADVMARFKRLDGFDVFFLTGTDEHGQKVEQAARRRRAWTHNPLPTGSRPTFVTWRMKMGVSFDDWIRTTEERHKVSCAELWRRIEASGNIYLGHYEGWYAVRDEAFYDEEELDHAARRQQGGAERRAGGVGEGAFVFLPAVSLAGQAAETVRRPARLHPARRPAQRGA